MALITHTHAGVEVTHRQTLVTGDPEHTALIIQALAAKSLRTPPQRINEPSPAPVRFNVVPVAGEPNKFNLRIEGSFGPCGIDKFTFDEVKYNQKDAVTNIPSFGTGKGSTFSADGTRLYNGGTDGSSLHIVSHTLSIPWDISTASYDSLSVELPLEEPIYMSVISGVFISSDGTQFYAIGTRFTADFHGQGFDHTDAVVRQYTLSTAYDISTASETSDLVVVAETENPGGENKNSSSDGLTFSVDGTRLYVTIQMQTSSSDRLVRSYTLSTAWDLSTATVDDLDLNITDLSPAPRGIDICENGDRIYVVDISNDTIFEYSLSDAFDITTATLTVESFDLSSTLSLSGPQDLRIGNDGLSLYIVNSTDPSGPDPQGMLWQFSIGRYLFPASSSNPLPTYKEGGNAREVFTEVSGLEDFEGVCLGIGAMGVVSDGDVVNQLCATTSPNCVTDGKITLCNSASRLHVGWRYISDVETLDIESQSGTMQGKIKRIPSVTIRFKKSRLGLVGPDRFHLTKMKQRDQELMGAPTSLLTGDKQVKLQPQWNSHGRIFYRQLDPLPFTILAIIPDLNLEDGPDD